MKNLFLTFGNYTQEIDPETKTGNLNTLWAYGNGLRILRGVDQLSLKEWLRSSETLEFLNVLSEDKEITSPLIKTKRGKGGGTWAHLYILLDAAARLDPNFKHQMYKTFVEGRILQWREDSGDEFINLNIAIDAYLPEREGKENTGIFIQVAKQLKAKILNGEEVWNTATFNQLEKRAKIEKDLCGFLKLGMIRNYEHLKEVIAKL
jgi:hypothetical protein